MVVAGIQWAEVVLSYNQCLLKFNWGIPKAMTMDIRPQCVCGLLEAKGIPQIHHHGNGSMEQHLKNDPQVYLAQGLLITDAPVLLGHLSLHSRGFTCFPDAGRRPTVQA